MRGEREEEERREKRESELYYYYFILYLEPRDLIHFHSSKNKIISKQ
jgi:hypothetical protein